MANKIDNAGKWGPVVEGSEKSYDGRQITLYFDNVEATSIMYTDTFGVAISDATEFIWNTEAVNCEDTADMEIMWQGTDDPSVANAPAGSGMDVAASDTGWTTVTIMDLDAGGKCDARTAVNLAGVSNVVNKAYMRLKFVLTAANPGVSAPVRITCRLSPLPILASVTHNTTL